MMLEPPDQKRRTQHEQGVGDNGSRDGRLDQNVLSGTQRGQRDEQLGKVSQGGVQQTAYRVTRPGCDGFGGAAEQRSQRNDRQHRQHK